MLVFFHILVPQEYWVLMESRIPLKLKLGGTRIVALSISYHEQGTGPHNTVRNMSGYRCESDCISRDPEFDSGPVPYFAGD